MARILFMTVGTGIGVNKEEKIKSLAHGLLVCIEHYRPDNVVFFGSDQSMDTIESIKEQYYEQHQEEFTDYEFVEIKNVDNFDDCFYNLIKKLEEYQQEEVIIDYTSGTKTMTIGAAISSILYHKKLSSILGKRGEKGIVIPNTEKITEQNLYSFYDKLLLNQVKELFNNYRFGAASKVLEAIVIQETELQENYKFLIKAYDLWDKFRHQEAFAELTKIGKQHGENKAFLGKLLQTSEEKRELNYIADLLNNTERRIEEEKYDDATARSYRVIELIAQYRLRDKYQLISSDIKIKRLKELGVKNQDIEQYKSLKGVNKKIKIPLQKNYELLNTIEDNLGKMFIKDKEMKNLLKIRNNSILAHGLHTVRKEDAINFFNTAKLYAEEVSKEKVDLEELRKIALFPKLE